MGVAAEERQRIILEQIRENGKILVNDLATNMGVTEVTIRRDLTFLQKNGLVKKTYGGAVVASPEVNESVRYRQTRNLKAKKMIGKLAAELVNDGDNIYLEAGSTCYEIIPYLVDKKELTIITNSLYLMKRLHEMTKHKVIIIGGFYRHERMDMVGPGAEAAIAQYSGYKAFTGADDIAVEAGISGADVVTVGFAKLVLKRAKEIIFVGDKSKFDNPALYKIADIEAINHIVTDTPPSQSWHKACKQKNIELIYPK